MEKELDIFIKEKLQDAVVDTAFMQEHWQQMQTMITTQPPPSAAEQLRTFINSHLNSIITASITIAVMIALSVVITSKPKQRMNTERVINKPPQRVDLVPLPSATLSKEQKQNVKKVYRQISNTEVENRRLSINDSAKVILPLQHTEVLQRSATLKQQFAFPKLYDSFLSRKEKPLKKDTLDIIW